ncbi:nitroreductase family protein [Alistipes shahii]|uniref:nitroreductase family protein n=1 Tax=Alistipes shahii TaxID=328814 RepID=UPI003F9E5C94
MDFLKLAKKRYACRKYLSRQVEPEKLELILEAGRVAPTGANRQPQRLVVVQSKEGMERLAPRRPSSSAPTPPRRGPVSTTARTFRTSTRRSSPTT